MTFPCAIAPLDQAATQLGWHQGTFTLAPCPVMRSCMQRQEGLQFLADPGTPVVAPFDARVTREDRGMVLTVQFPMPGVFAQPIRVRVSGILPEAGNGPVQKGMLLGRIARSARPSATFELVGGSMTAFFVELGLDVVGGERIRTPGYSLTPFQGGRLLVRASGPANCPATGLHGLGYALGADVAPAGYVEPDPSVYGRFGPSRLTNTNLTVPSGTRDYGGGWGLLGWIAVFGGVAWAATRR